MTTHIARVASLSRFPVSSLGGESLTDAQVLRSGLQGDRLYGFFERATGTHIYPARDPRWNRAPELTARLAPDLQVSEDGRHWHADLATIQDHVSRFFGHAVDLHRYDGRRAPRYKVAPLHVISLQAFRRLGALLPDSAIDARRFRANIVLDMPDELGDVPEYALLGQTFRVGDVVLRGSNPCGRCAFTTLRMNDLPTDPAVLQTLVRQYERNFGIYCEVVAEGRIHVDDAVAAKCKSDLIAPVVIAGGGQAGIVAARSLRKLGYDGEISVFAAERHLPYERPPLSKRIGQTVQNHDPFITDQEARDLSLSINLGQPVTQFDAQARTFSTAGGIHLRYGTLILATGGTARQVPGLDNRYGRVHVLRTLDDADRLNAALRPGSRVVVFGGGWIGMEMAAATRMAGAHVTLLARSATFAPRILPPVVAQRLEDLHRQNGVHLEFSVSPHFEEHEDGVEHTSGGKTGRADHLLVAVGMEPADGMARRAGLACDGGVLTDGDGFTGIDGVFAIGDVSHQPGGRIESWQNANEQAGRAAHRILGVRCDAQEPLRFWSEQFGRRLQIVGLPDPAAALVEASEDFWDFGSFAIGLDRPQLIHQASRRLAGTTATPAAAHEDTRERVEHPLALASIVSEGQLVRLDHPSGPLAITRQNGRVFATDDRCPHAVASLADGFVGDGHIVCPVHFAEFDLKTGVPRHAPDGCGHLTTHPVIERGDHLYVLLPADRTTGGSEERQPFVVAGR